VFGDCQFFDELPEGLRLSIGLDFAYSVKASADFSASVLLGRSTDGRVYVLDVIHVREEPTAFRARVKSLVDRYPHATLNAYISGTESGIVAFFADGGLRVNASPASADKFTRAIACAAAWNTGKVLLPRAAPWVNAFVSEVVGFTGIKDRHDDQVDALAAAFDASMRVGVRRVNPVNLPDYSGRGWMNDEPEAREDLPYTIGERWR
jgi:predicted phage terminase large subunit-like protein